MWFILKGGTGFGCAFPQPKPKKEKEPMKLITATLVAITGLSLCAAPQVWQHLVDHPERPNAWKWGAKARRESLFRCNVWTVSDNGATSPYVSTETRPDGSSPHDETRLKRTAGGTSGLVGTWESTEIKIGSPTMLQIASWEGDGYSQ